jgi:hypothetical protein
VPQERLVPIALLRSGRCECDDPLLRTTPSTTDAPEPVLLRVSTVTSASRPLPAGTAPRSGGRDRIQTLPKMVKSRCPSGMSRFLGGEDTPGMAAERNPFSEVPPKTDCQPRHRPSRAHAPRADAGLSARRLNQTGPSPPHHGRLATRAGEVVRTKPFPIPVHLSAVSATGSDREKSGNPPTGAQAGRTTARNDDNRQPITTSPSDTYEPRQRSDRAAACPSDANEHSTDHRFAALVPTEPDRPFAHRHHHRPARRHVV